MKLQAIKQDRKKKVGLFYSINQISRTAFVFYNFDYNHTAPSHENIVLNRFRDRSCFSEGSNFKRLVIFFSH